jgi:hypothetical protein
VNLFYEKTDNMAADVFTKGFVDVVKWLHACRLINHVYPREFWPPAVKGTGGVSSPTAGTAGKRGTAVCSVVLLPSVVGAANNLGIGPGAAGISTPSVVALTGPGSAGMTGGVSQKAIVSCNPGPASAAPIHSTVAITKQERRQMIAVCFGTVPRMHNGSARGRNCDIKVVELMNEPFRSNDWSTLVFNRTTMVHIELPLTTGDERKFDAWVKLCIRLLDKCVENGGTIVVLCPFNANSRVVSVFVRSHVDFVAISMGDQF